MSETAQTPQTPKKKDSEKEKEQNEKKEQQQLQNKIKSMVEKDILEKLGKPPQLKRIVIVPLWDNRFRVNIWCGQTDREGREGDFVTHSFRAGDSRWNC